jgi:hypothetical protein
MENKTNVWNHQPVISFGLCFIFFMIYSTHCLHILTWSSQFYVTNYQRLYPIIFPMNTMDLFIN